MASRCAALAVLALLALVAPGWAGCAGAGKAPAPVLAPVAIRDAGGRLLVTIAVDGAMTDGRGARVGSFDARTSSITTPADPPGHLALAGAVTVAGDRIVIDVPGAFDGKLAFEVRPDGALLLGGRRWGSVDNAGSTLADRWRIAAGLVLIPTLSPPGRSR
ncbi:MAG TPA: hypothetical protein VKB80_06160 [Kofleriaceae bacterium]|nr:hypothetical protein [Kofleriaceae bacterium]